MSLSVGKHTKCTFMYIVRVHTVGLAVATPAKVRTVHLTCACTAQNSIVR